MSSEANNEQKTDYERIIEYVTKGAGAGQAYTNLANFVDRFGSRLVGTQRLEDAIDQVVAQLKACGLQVHTEPFSFVGWQRGEESAELTSPFTQQLPMLGLGYSVPTDGVLDADCVVVRTFDELERLGEGAVRGKMVVYNQVFENYGKSVQYRTVGASKAAKLGAVAVLVRSVTPFSIGSPHTGMQKYEAGVKKIPACCITVEDAEMMYRMYSRGDQLRVRLRMSCGPTQQLQSRNIVADLVGSELPDELVVVCGHIDSWDVGQGAMDDGGGAFVAAQAVRTLLDMGMKPRRTVRLVMFSGEELGILGGQEFYRKYRDELASKISFMLESDSGTFRPYGLTCSGSEATRTAMRQALSPLTSLNVSTIVSTVAGPDITYWAESGVPVGDLLTRRSGQPDDFYFYFHHTEGDSMTVQNSTEMDLCVATFAVVALTLANAPSLLPRDTRSEGSSDSEWELV